MTERSFIERHPRLALQRDGVEDEKEKAAYILAQCQDKPVRRITTAADIPVGTYPPLRRDSPPARRMGWR